MNKQIVQWILLGIVIVASISLISVYLSSYAPEFMMPKALPLAIVVGLSSIALAIAHKE